MRRDLVEAALGAASDLLFEDVLYTHAPTGPVAIAGAIAGVEIASEDYDMSGAPVRQGTHATRAVLAKLPLLAAGDLIDDGTTVYRVIDFRPVGDGRLEVEISLVVSG